MLKVPVGTVVREYFEEEGEVGEMIADLTTTASRSPWRAAAWAAAATSTSSPPRVARRPSPSWASRPRKRWIELEMKLMADAALVGMPSAGKSSLIAKMSAARPKIADYPFTTLVPNLGVATSGDLSFVVADIPGSSKGPPRAAGWGMSSCAILSARPSSCRSSI